MSWFFSSHRFCVWEILIRIGHAKDPLLSPLLWAFMPGKLGKFFPLSGTLPFCVRVLLKPLYHHHHHHQHHHSWMRILYLFLSLLDPLRGGKSTSIWLGGAYLCFSFPTTEGNRQLSVGKLTASRYPICTRAYTPNYLNISRKLLRKLIIKVTILRNFWYKQICSIERGLRTKLVETLI